MNRPFLAALFSVAFLSSAASAAGAKDCDVELCPEFLDTDLARLELVSDGRGFRSTYTNVCSKLEGPRQNRCRGLYDDDMLHALEFPPFAVVVGLKGQRFGFKLGERAVAPKILRAIVARDHGYDHVLELKSRKDGSFDLSAFAPGKEYLVYGIFEDKPRKGSPYDFSLRKSAWIVRLVDEPKGHEK